MNSVVSNSIVSIPINFICSTLQQFTHLLADSKEAITVLLVGNSCMMQLVRLVDLLKSDVIISSNIVHVVIAFILTRSFA